MSTGPHTEFPEAQRLIDADHRIRLQDKELSRLRSEGDAMQQRIDGLLTDRARVIEANRAMVRRIIELETAAEGMK